MFLHFFSWAGPLGNRLNTLNKQAVHYFYMMDSVLKQLKKPSILFVSGLFEHVSLSGGQV